MKLLKWLDKNLEEYILVILSVVMTIVIFLQVIMRYVFQNSLIWSEELAIYCFIWIVFIGTSYAVKKNTHIKIDVILIPFKEKGKDVFYIISQFIFLVFAVFLLINGYQIVEQLMEWNEESPAMRLPMWMVFISAPLGMLLIIIRIIQDMVLHFNVSLHKG